MFIIIIIMFRPTRRGSTFTLGERAWLDGFDGENDTGVFFAASLRDHSIYLLKWKDKPARKISVPLGVPSAQLVAMPKLQMQAVSSNMCEDDEYVTLAECEAVGRSIEIASQVASSLATTNHVAGPAAPKLRRNSLTSDIFDVSVAKGVQF